jgi:hypothetical protein
MDQIKLGSQCKCQEKGEIREEMGQYLDGVFSEGEILEP